MPTAPILPPDQMQAAQSAGQMGGVSPANFLMAAADLHSSGALSAPSGPKDSPLAKRPVRKLKVIK